jgi:hypothetical protein
MVTLKSSVALTPTEMERVIVFSAFNVRDLFADTVSGT